MSTPKAERPAIDRPERDDPLQPKLTVYSLRFNGAYAPPTGVSFRLAVLCPIIWDALGKIIDEPAGQRARADRAPSDPERYRADSILVM